MTITTDEVFAWCKDFLTFQKTYDTVLLGKSNEMLWKVALDEKAAQDESIDNWVDLVTKVKSKCHSPYCGLNLSVSKIESI